MRSTRVRAAVGLTAAITMLSTGIAAADNVTNNVVSGGNDTIVAGTATTISYSIQNTSAGGGSFQSCDATASSPAVLHVDAPAGVTATPEQLTFTSCGASQPVSFTSSVAGSYSVTVDVVDDQGNYNANGAAFTLKVTAPAPSDTTAPSIAPSIVGSLGDNGWYTSDVALSWSVADDESTVTSTTGCDTVTITADQDDTTYTCTATSAGGTSSESVTIRRDATAPTITGSRTPAANANGWDNTDVAVAFDCDDVLSGVVSCGPDTTVTAEGADQSVTGSAVDAAGNTGTATVDGIAIDRTAPTVTLTGGPADGATYYPHQLGSLIAPTCAATDALSGLAGDCSVNGFSTALGTHSLAATATDKADNTTTTTGASYTVANYTTRGFFAPVDMGANVVNTVKGGSTVPLKFEVLAGQTEMTATSVVTGLGAKKVVCTTGNVIEDAIENLATGGTALRYDSTAGQFVFNWQTPKAAGSCYLVTVTLDGGTTISASFKLK